ncbi:MAG: hypothetical protein ACUVS6_15405 [Anaerolineae bacterium]
MKSKVLFFSLLMVVLAVIALSAGHDLVLAHRAAPEWAEVWTGEARLFVADNARSEIVAVDLPDGQKCSTWARLTIMTSCRWMTASG